MKIVYLLFFALASRLPVSKQKINTIQNRIAVLIPAYKEDAVIEECVKSFLANDYADELYTIVVISDKMEATTIEKLRALKISIFEVQFEQSTKTKALNYALSRLPDAEYDIALIIDADNVVEPTFLTELNSQFSDGFEAVQAHRISKNPKTNIAILDSVSEEINNSIFRKGHANLGLSSSLIGSGMAFRFAEFKSILSQMESIGGFDKELEHIYLMKRYMIGYLPRVMIYDEKVSDLKNFGNQRRRWMSAQLHYMRKYHKQFIPALKSRNINLADKIFQMTLPPRILLVLLTFIAATAITFASMAASVKWWVLLAILIFSLLVSIPRYLFTIKLLRAICSLPKSVFILVLNLFKIKGANKSFIHTTHGD